MKTMIVIFGREGRGKSSAIRAVANKMGLTPPSDGLDFTGTVKYKDYLIGFASQGDPNSNQKKWIDGLIGNGCEVIVCASRTKGKTTDNAIELARQYGYRLIWTSNYSIDKSLQVSSGVGAEEIHAMNEHINTLFAGAMKCLIEDILEAQ